MAKGASLEKLFEPGRIGKMEIRNRIVLPAASLVTDSSEGFVTDVTKDYYEARAKGGVGLIIAGACSVTWPLGISGKPRLSIHDDKFIPGLSEVVQVVHRHGAKVALQLQHAGPAAPENVTHMQPVAASAIARPTYPPPRELSVTEIQEIVTQFAKAAQRTQQAGLDGIELHGGHRYLVNSFLSPFFNKRCDEYGGDLEKRSRFLLEVIAAVREAVGHDYPVWCRINAEEADIEGGITIAMAKELAQILQKTKQVDAIHVTRWPYRSIGYPPGYLIDLAAQIKKVVNMPVIAVGRIDARLGEKVLRQQKADFIAMNRALIADPELPNKLASGRFEDVTPCINCDTCGYGVFTRTDLLIECTVNPSIHKKKEYEIHPAKKSKKVLVVGGGPAGMEAARVAALRGHQVVLYERESRLGGQLVLASILRKEYESLLKYLTTQISKLGVKVELGKEVDSALIRDINPDAIILTTGAVSSLPEIPGVNGSNVLSATAIQEMVSGRLKRGDAKGTVSWHRHVWYLGTIIMRLFGPSAVRSLLRIWAPFGKRVIVVGAGLPGMELAGFLVDRGKKVTILDKRKDIPTDEPPMPAFRRYLEDRLAEKGVAVLSGVRYFEAVTDKGLTIINKYGVRQTIEGDTVVFTADHKPDTELSRALAGIAGDLYQAGDCLEPCGIREAIRDGCRAGLAV